MIRLQYTLDGAATVIERDMEMAEAGKYGQAVKLNELGKLVKVAPTDSPVAILIADNALGIKNTEYIPVRADQVFEVDVTGDASTLVVGMKYGFDATGLLLDVAAASGAMLVMRVDPIKKKAIVRFAK